MPPNPTLEATPVRPPGKAAQWPIIVTTVLAAVFAFALVWPEIFPSPEQANGPTLANLNRRVPLLSATSDPIERDKYGIGLAAYGRMFDRAIPTNARVFLSGMVGKENTSRGGYYFFIRNYIFPHELEISLGKPAIYTSDGEAYMDVQDCTDPEVLRTNGFDVFLKFGSDNQIQYIPLTEKGVPKQ